MTFGRPAMISKASCGSVPLPATIDEEYIASASGPEVAQPADQPSIMAFYAKSLELYEILNDILLSLYKPVPEESPDDIYDFYFSRDTNEDELTIFELDRALTKWTRSLPPHLRGEPASGPNNMIFYRQTVVLRARWVVTSYLCSHMLRPFQISPRKDAAFQTDIIQVLHVPRHGHRSSHIARRFLPTTRCPAMLDNLRQGRPRDNRIAARKYTHRRNLRAPSSVVVQHSL